MSSEFWLMFGASLLSGVGVSAVAFVGHQLHQDLSGLLETVEDNEERSQTNRQVLVRVIRNAEGEMRISTERLAEDLETDA